MTERIRHLATSVGSVALPNPIMTASGTSGHGAELGRYVDLGTLGAVVCKSLLVDPWPGNPAPRVHETPAGMLNSVGLQGPGVRHWLDEDVPVLVASGARLVASLWGRTGEDYAVAAVVLASDQNIGVTNAEGAVIGVVTRQAMIAALFPESRS